MGRSRCLLRPVVDQVTEEDLDSGQGCCCFEDSSAAIQVILCGNLLDSGRTSHDDVPRWYFDLVAEHESPSRSYKKDPRILERVCASTFVTVTFAEWVLFWRRAFNDGRPRKYCAVIVLYGACSQQPTNAQSNDS
jgi:hypothetical protein